MTPDELARREEANRDLLEALGQLSQYQQAPSDFLEQVMARAAQVPVPRRGWLALLTSVASWPTTVVARVACAGAFVLALVGAVPQYITWVNAYVLGVSAETVYQAKTQERLWHKNFACATQIDRSSSNYALIDGEHVQVVTWVCPSGDVLVTLEPQAHDAYRRSIWIPLSARRQMTQRSSWPTREAVAASEWVRSSQNAAPIVGVLCQKWLPDRLIKRRVQLADNRCFDEIVNPRTGQVMSRQDAPCDRTC